MARASSSDRMARRDRKSTRLNSSHDQISYAVFCLKKKKTKITQSLPPILPSGARVPLPIVPEGRLSHQESALGREGSWWSIAMGAQTLGSESTCAASSDL